MYFLLIFGFIPIINALITTKIYRNSIYHSHSSCALINNITLPIDSSIQTCIWKCVDVYNCQTAVYFGDTRICLMYVELCEQGSIESFGNVLASVICYRKDHKPTITCSSTLTTNHDEEKTSYSTRMTSIEQSMTSITSTVITTPFSDTTAAISSMPLTTKNFYACGNMTVLIGYDLYGNDITSGILDNYTLCCEWCRTHSNCVSYTWVLPSAVGTGITPLQCFLKHSISSPSLLSTVISAHN